MDRTRVLKTSIKLKFYPDTGKAQEERGEIAGKKL
jgi:hypothetical protein